MALEFEEILPYVEGEGDTGKTAREKINRNFTKIEPLANVGTEMQQLRQDVSDDLEQLHDDVEEMVDKTTSLFGYYNCSTAGATAAKTVQATGYELTTGGNIRIKMEHANTAASPVTLQIGNAAAKQLYYNDEPVSSDNTWEDNEVIVVYYDGEKFLATNSLGGETKQVEELKDKIDGFNYTHSYSFANQNDSTYIGRGRLNSDGSIKQEASNSGYLLFKVHYEDGMDNISLSVGMNDGAYYAFCCYDENDNYIEGSGKPFSAVGTEVTVEGAIPPNTSYILVSNRPSVAPTGNGTIVFLKKSLLDEAKSYTDEKIEEVEEGIDDAKSYTDDKVVEIEESISSGKYIEEPFSLEHYTPELGYYIVGAAIVDGMNITPIAQVKPYVQAYFIPVEKIKSFTINNTGSQDMFIAVLDSMPTLVDGATVSFNSEYSSLIKVGAAGTKTVTFNSTARYLYIQATHTTATYLTQFTATYIHETTLSYSEDRSIVLCKAEKLARHILNWHVSSTKWESGQSYIIPVTPGNVYKIVASDRFNANYCYLTDLDNYTSSTPPHYCRDTDYAVVTKGCTALTEVPLDARYLYIAYSRQPKAILYSKNISIEFIRQKAGTNNTIQRNMSGLYNHSWSWWTLPLAQYINNNLFFAFCDSNAYVGVQRLNLDDFTISRRNLFMTTDNVGSPAPDDHNAPCVVKLPDNRLMVAYTGGHNSTTNLYIDISVSASDLFNFRNTIVIPMGGVTSYVQYLYINGLHYLFTRVGGVTWQFIYSQDAETWSEPQRFLLSNDQSDWLVYCLFAKVLNENNIVRFAMYENPEDHNGHYSDVNIRIGYLNFDNGNIYDADGTTVLGEIGTGVPKDSFSVVIAEPSTDGVKQRLFDLADTDINTIEIAYTVFTYNREVHDAEYYVYKGTYNNGTIYDVCFGGKAFWLPKYQGGMKFLDKDTVLLSRCGTDMKDYIEKWKFYEGDDEWKKVDVYWSECIGERPIRNFRPIFADEGNFILWQRGYRNYYNFSDFETTACIYDGKKGVLYVQ